ncbi:MAG: DNA methyltransferase [Thermoguttaceae bacterium]
MTQLQFFCDEEMVTTKKRSENIKIEGNGDSLAKYFAEKQRDAGTTNQILESLGHLPRDFNGDFLYKLLSHPHSQVRFNAAKNIGKLNGAANDVKLIEQYKIEKDTTVKRELVSAVGRLRKQENKAFLLETLSDEDPKIVCQAIRGLLVWGTESDVKEHLKPLVNHPNETVRTVIYKQFFARENRSLESLPHPQTYPFLKNVVVNADVLDALKSVPDESVHLTFTSPPYYNARDYSIYPSYQAYLEFLESVFKETHRITKEGRFLIVNTSPIIIPRVSRSHSSKRYGIPFDLHPYIVKNGWVFVDDIIWMKPEASVKNRVGGFMQHRKPLGYKPNPITEYLMVYRKETDRLLDWNIRSYSEQVTEDSKVEDGYETSNVWKIDPSFDKVHSAIFPVELCKKVIQYYSYKGDLIFDPFAGSGTVGKTANALDRFFFLTEKNTEYFEYMKRKIDDRQFFGEYRPRFFDLPQFEREIK